MCVCTHVNYLSFHRSTSVSPTVTVFLLPIVSLCPNAESTEGTLAEQRSEGQTLVQSLLHPLTMQEEGTQGAAALRGEL